MYFLGLKILIFILVHETIAGKYYYNDKNGLYDVYYGPNSIRGYKEFRSPKSYKFGDKGDRPGKCTPGIFECKTPFEVKETNIFECEIDYQCPSQYKCCQVSCFQHKICQPASTEDDKENEVPSANPPVVTEIEFSTKPSTKTSIHPVTKSTAYVKSTTQLEDSSIEYSSIPESTDVPTPAAQSQVHSTLETAETSLTTGNTSVATNKPVSRITEKTSTPSTLPASKTPHIPTTTSRSTLKPHKSSSVTSNINSKTSTPSTLPTSRTPHITATTRRSIRNPHEETLETSQTTSNIYSTSISSTLPASRKPDITNSTRNSTLKPRSTTLDTSQATSDINYTSESSTTTIRTTDEDISTYDEDLIYSGDFENADADMTTYDDDSGFSGDSGGIDADISIYDDDEGDNADDDEDLTFSGDSSTLDEGAGWSTLGTKTTNIIISSSAKPHSKRTTSEITRASETTITFLTDTATESSELSTIHPSNESQTIPIISTPKSILKTTELFITTTKAKSSSPKLSTQKSTTRNTDITSDDEANLDNIGTESHDSSTESDDLNKLSSLVTSFTSVKPDLASSPDKNESANIIKTTRKSSPISESTSTSSILATSSSEFFTSTINTVEPSSTDKDGSKSMQTLSSDSTTGTAFHKLSTLSEISSPLTSSTESIRSTEKPVETSTVTSTLTVSSTSSDLPTSVGTALPELTTTTKVNKDTISDDEDLSFSGSGAEDTSIADNITFYTSTSGNIITNVPTKVTSSEINVPTRVTSSETEEKTTNTSATEISPQSSSEKNDADDDDLIFSDDHQIKTTKSTVSQTATLPETAQKNTNFSFSDKADQSTKMDKASTEKPKSDMSSVSYTTDIRPSSTETLRTKLISSTVSAEEIKVQTSTEVTDSNKNFSTKGSDSKDWLTKNSYTTPSTISTDKSSRPYPISSTTKIRSTKLTTETGDETTTKAATTNANEDAENIPGGESIFVNSLLGLLRKVPTVIISQGSTDNTDPYFSNFLQFLGRFSSLVKKPDLDIDLINENNESSTQRVIETVVPS